jgi:hypothetical protein
MSPHSRLLGPSSQRTVDTALFSEPLEGSEIDGAHSSASSGAPDEGAISQKVCAGSP